MEPEKRYETNGGGWRQWPVGSTSEAAAARITKKGYRYILWVILVYGKREREM